MHRILAIDCNRLQPIEICQRDGIFHPGIGNIDLSRVTSSLDDNVASAADASTDNGETNPNWTNNEVATFIDIWANVEIQGQLNGMRRSNKLYERISEEMAARV